MTDRPENEVADRLRASAIVLAAGKAERVGRNKLLLPLGGRSVLNRVVTTALASALDEVVVVLGHYVEDLVPEIPTDRRVKVIHNPHYEEGQHSSLKAGLRAVDDRSNAVVVLLGDQPLVSAGAIDALVAEFRMRGPAIVVPTYEGRTGHPVLFSAKLFPELLSARESEGRRSVMQRHQGEVATVAVDGQSPYDIDTWQDYVAMAGHQLDSPR